MQGRILASKDPRAAGKKCRGHLLGNMLERGGQNGDQFILEEWDRLESRIFPQTQERHRRATCSAPKRLLLHVIRHETPAPIPSTSNAAAQHPILAQRTLM